VPIRFLSTKVFMLFYVLIAPILLALSFDSILSLNARIKRKKLVADILFDRVAVAGLMVDFDAQQRRPQQRTRQQRRQRKQRGRRCSTRKFTTDVNSSTPSQEDPKSPTNPGNDIEEEKAHDYQPLPPGLFQHAGIIQDTIFRSDPERGPTTNQQDPRQDPLQDTLQGPENSQEQSEFLQDEDTESIFSESIFGPFAHPPRTTEEEEGMFGLPDGAEVSKSDFVVSVLLYLGKIRYESDVYVWCKVRVII